MTQPDGGTPALEVSDVVAGSVPIVNPEPAWGG